MATQFTPAKKLPYPQSSDPVAQGADAIRRLAQSVDNMVQAGIVTVPITALNTNADVAVNFPVPFASAPVAVTLTTVTGTPQTCVVSVSSGAPPTAAGFTARGQRTSGGVQTFDCYWVAIGPVGVVALAAESDAESEPVAEPEPETADA
jgi:hypothetical protein